jgi:hypothetical protein
MIVAKGANHAIQKMNMFIWRVSTFRFRHVHHSRINPIVYLPLYIDRQLAPLEWTFTGSIVTPPSSSPANPEWALKLDMKSGASQQLEHMYKFWLHLTPGREPHPLIQWPIAIRDHADYQPRLTSYLCLPESFQCGNVPYYYISFPVHGSLAQTMSSIATHPTNTTANVTIRITGLYIQCDTQVWDVSYSVNQSPFCVVSHHVQYHLGIRYFMP